MREITQENYFYKTQAKWMPCAIPERQPDFISDSGSRYWYGPNGVTRSSNHWGTVGTCK
jgi:hypothetical protein